MEASEVRATPSPAAAAPSITSELAPGPGRDEPAALEIWRHHFHLVEDPFALTPDPSFFYPGEEHAEALAALRSGLLEDRGLMVMIGEVGTGKTSIVYSLLSSLDSSIETAYVSNTALSFDEILVSALKNFGVALAGYRRIDLLEALNGFLCRCAERDKTAALVIDEAQNLSDEAFEQLRSLLSFGTQGKKSLRIVLVGQPELAERLAHPRLRRIVDQIATRCDLNPLSPKEARSYVAHRLEAAGGSTEIFTRAASKLLVKEARGFPRRINSLGHNAMLLAYGKACSRVDRSLISQAAREKAGKGLARQPSPERRHRNASRPFRSLAGSRNAWLGAAALVVLVLAATVALSPATPPRDLSAPSTPPATAAASVMAHEAVSAPPPAAAPLAGSIAEQSPIVAADEAALTTARLRLRAGPGLGHTTITTLPLSTRIEILDSRGDWLRVRPLVQEGWVARQYVRIEAPAIETESRIAAFPSGERRPTAR